MKTDSVLKGFTSEEIIQLASSLDCACPRHVLDIITAIRELKKEQHECLARNPQGVVVHSWLLGEAEALEKMTADILRLLLQKENILTEDFRLNPGFNRKSK